MNVKDVKALNERIENIQTQRTKAEARREMLMAKLKSEIAKYEDAYGVNISGKDLKETINLITKEKEKVTKTIQAEYELKVKVVTAIEGGNIDEANKLLGIKPVEVVEEEVVEETVTAQSETDDDFGLEDSEEWEESDTWGEEDDDDYYEEEDSSFGNTPTFFTNTVEKNTPATIDVKDFASNSDEDTPDFGFDFEEEEELAEDIKPKTLDFSDVMVDDFGVLESDEDDDYEDFGFGDMLSGSKFDF